MGATSFVFKLAFTGSGRLEELPDEAAVAPVAAGTAAAVVIVPAGFDCEGTDADDGCADGAELTFSATVFGAGEDAGASGTPAVWRMYQAPPPMSKSKPAAIPIIRPFLLELPVVVARMSDSSVNRRLPKDGAATAALAASGTAEISVMARSGSSKTSR